MERYNSHPAKNRILIVDDDLISREILKNIFPPQYTFVEAEDGQAGLIKAEAYKDELAAILLDLQMPKLNGLELLTILNQRQLTEKIPVFLITANEEDTVARESYALGAMDVISKPVKPFIILRRVQTVMELFHARESLMSTVEGQKQQLRENAHMIDDLQKGTIEALATAIEFRNVESGQHVNRIYAITKHILTHTELGAGFSYDEIESIAQGAIMHDVGKIAVPDAILNKPGKLTAEEFEEMKLHTVRGAELLSSIAPMQLHGSYEFSRDIAQHHHERWDGNGYPDGLKGDEITIWSQIVSIADVYDALISDRVYKKAFTPDEAMNMIRNGECGVFNPKLLRCFSEVEPTIRRWYESNTTPITTAAGEEPSARKSPPSLRSQMSQGAMDVALLMTAMKSAYDLIISVNLTRNSYYTVDGDGFLNHSNAPDGVFDELIFQGASTIPLSHRELFLQAFSRESLFRAFAEGKRSVALEHPQYAADGGVHWIETSVLFAEDARTGDLLEITISRNIDELHNQREQATKMLSDSLALAERANRAKSDFLSQMSHDIRTPLNAITGMTTIIASNLYDPDKISDCLSKIRSSSRYLLGLLGDILDFSKIESGKLSLSEEQFDFRQMLEDLSTLIDMRAADKKQHFTAHAEDAISRLYVGDEVRIRQILMNLLENATKYTGENGSITFSAKLHERAEQYDILDISVEDNGIGIQEEFLEHLFNPFAQANTRNGKSGVGLGLAIAHNLAHLMNGELSVRSKPGSGSRFTLTLPLRRGEAVPASETVPAPHSPSIVGSLVFNGEHILVAEDNDMNQEIVRVILGDMGLHVDITANGREAVERFTASAPGEYFAILMDVMMPEMGGYEATRCIRASAHPSAKTIPIYAMTANAFYDDIIEAQNSGMNGHIAKPIDFDEVGAILQHILAENNNNL